MCAIWEGPFKVVQGRRKSLHLRSGVVVLLILLIIVVVGMLVWLDPTALFHDTDESLPWNQEYRLIKRGEDAELVPSEEQHQLNKSLEFGFTALEEGKKRGEIDLVIYDNGRVRGNWSGDYRVDDKTTRAVMLAPFTGNIDPTNVYSGEEGEDLSKLYFMCKGNFIILENQSGFRDVQVKGLIYVTGWLDTDNRAFGEVIITSDKKYFERYEWQGSGYEKMYRWYPDDGSSDPMKLIQTLSK